MEMLFFGEILQPQRRYKRRALARPVEAVFWPERFLIALCTPSMGMN